MGAKTKIDWADASWNPVTGCLHGCEYCYASNIAYRFGSIVSESNTENGYDCDFYDGTGENHVLDKPAMREWKNGKITKAPYPFCFDPTFHRYKLDEPQHWKKPRNIFVCSMADLFGNWVPDEWLQEIFEACDKASQHRYMFLTKNPGRYMELPDLLPKHRRPPNVAEMWFGQSFTGAAHNYTPLLLPLWQNRFTSIEPLLRNLSRAEAIEIAEKAWIDNIATACAELGKPIFMKESLRGLMGPDFRQEFPWEE